MARCTPAGAQRLARRLLTNDPPTVEDLQDALQSSRDLVDHYKAELEAARGEIERLKLSLLIYSHNAWSN